MDFGRWNTDFGLSLLHSSGNLLLPPSIVFFALSAFPNETKNLEDYFLSLSQNDGNDDYIVRSFILTVINGPQGISGQSSSFVSTKSTYLEARDSTHR